MEVTNPRTARIPEDCQSDDILLTGFKLVPERFREPPTHLGFRSPDTPGGYEPPSSFGGLTASIRDPLARFGGDPDTVEPDPVGLLATAANLYDRGELQRARALAETVVTGRSGYAALQSGLITRDAVLESDILTGSPDIEDAVDDVLDRIYRVAWALEGLTPRLPAAFKHLEKSHVCRGRE